MCCIVGIPWAPYIVKVKVSMQQGVKSEDWVESFWKCLKGGKISPSQAKSLSVNLKRWPASWMEAAPWGVAPCITLCVQRVSRFNAAAVDPYGSHCSSLSPNSSSLSWRAQRNWNCSFSFVYLASVQLANICTGVYPSNIQNNKYKCQLAQTSPAEVVLLREWSNIQIFIDRELEHELHYFIVNLTRTWESILLHHWYPWHGDMVPGHFLYNRENLIESVLAKTGNSTVTKLLTNIEPQ